jgi:hypothetical protein
METPQGKVEAEVTVMRPEVVPEGDRWNRGYPSQRWWGDVHGCLNILAPDCWRWTDLCSSSLPWAWLSVTAGLVLCQSVRSVSTGAGRHLLRSCVSSVCSVRKCAWVGSMDGWKREERF